MTTAEKLAVAACAASAAFALYAVAVSNRKPAAPRQHRAAAPDDADQPPPMTATVPHLPQFRAPALEVIDEGVLLWAIAEVESRNNDAAVGTRGERGRWQFMAATWRGLMPKHAHAEAADYAVAATAAHKLYARILETLNKRGMAVTVENIAMAWNLGEWFNEAKATTAYARSVAHLYADRVAAGAQEGGRK